VKLIQYVIESESRSEFLTKESKTVSKRYLSSSSPQKELAEICCKEELQASLSLTMSWCDLSHPVKGHKTATF
jgi:hypothetical protein